MKTISAGVAALILAGAAAGPALANGCNGHVEQFRLGCAVWDNNNGPQYPYYQGGSPAPVARSAPAQPPRLAVPTNQQMLINRNGGAGVINAGGGNVINTGGGNLRGAYGPN